MADLTGALQAAAGTAASAGGAADPNFNQTVLLLHGDGTNGAQNNTFLDSSTNNFTVTRNGNTTQGTFSPFSVADGKWSNYFQNAVADYLTTPSNAAFGMGTGEWTIEGWFYTIRALESFNVSWHIGAINAVDGMAGSVATTSVGFRSNGQTDISSSVSIANQWTHIAWVKSGNTVTIYVNGTSVTSGTYTNSIATGVMTIGYNATQFRFGGYISNLRVIKGTAVYTSTFTPPTAPLTAISGTSLLTCQSNRFVDNSSNAFAITVNGNTSVQPFSPFAPSAAYSPSVNGGSGYFDGSGDYLTVPDDVAFDLSGDYTMEGWYYTPSTSSPIRLIAVGKYTSGSNGTTLYAATSSRNLTYYVNGSTIIGTSTPLPIGQWNHICVVRSGAGTNNTALFLNGERIGQATNTTSITGNASNGASIGAEYGTSYNIGQTMYASDVRIVKDTAVYDPTQTTITVPTAPLTAIANTSLLLSATNPGIFDNTGKNNLETVGNAQIDTATKKYGTGSMEFDGTGDYLLLRPNPQLIFEGDFTIEFWCYITLAGSSYHSLIGNYNGSATTNWQIEVQDTGVIRLYYNGSSSPIVSSSGVITNETWQHIAAVRSGSTVALYVDGSQISTASFSGTLGNTTTNTLIASIPQTSAQELDGFIDDLRITKGVARYTTTFTPPTAPFPDQ